MDSQNTYIAIDLKSFYASVECVKRGLDPLTTNLVVADPERTEKTICLAVSPSLKAYGIPGRPRLFEVIQKVREIKATRNITVEYIIAQPHMAEYLECSTRIYEIYLKYFAPEDIHVYSIDEVFIEITHYLATYQLNAEELVSKIIHEILDRTGITATAGIGTNLYLCKIAMDIVAKHAQPDARGIRIASLDEITYRKLLWNHKPLRDFWRVGRGYVKKLEEIGLFTMGDIARYSLKNEEILYRIFGVNAELLIDHAWGYEPCTMQQIKAYKPTTNSIGTGQVLHCPYTFEAARIILQEMLDLLVLDLVDKGLKTDQIVLTVGYDIDNLNTEQKQRQYTGEITTDYYGRKVPKHAHGTTNLSNASSSTKLITEATLQLYNTIVNQHLLIRRINITANHVVSEQMENEANCYEQLDLFTDYETLNKELEKEKQLQHAMLDIKKKFGKNAILKGMNLQEGATTIEIGRAHV